MRPFRQFLGEEVKEITPDKHLAQATREAAQKRLAYAKRIHKTEEPHYVVENAFEAIRQSIDAHLFEKGYKSYSHDATIAYLQELRFSPADINCADMLRKQRNNIKYYGEESTAQDAEFALRVAQNIIAQLTSESDHTPQE